MTIAIWRASALRISVMATILVVSRAVADEPTGLALSDLTAYRESLDGSPAGPAIAVTFRRLWDFSNDFERKRVRIEGRVARRFRQGAFGTFPPLVESWVVTPAGDPFCLVYPVPAADEKKIVIDPGPGARVRFEGVYLKRLKYQASDTERLGLLIVGNQPPIITSLAPLPLSATIGGYSGIDLAMGLGWVELPDGIGRKYPNVFSPSLRTIYCEDNGLCGPTLNGLALYGDNNHLTQAGAAVGARLLAKWIEERLIRNREI